MTSSTAQYGKYTHLLVPELNQPWLINNHFVSLILAITEELRQRKPLPRHLVSVVGVHKLVIVDAVRSVSFDFFDGRSAAVQIDYVFDECLASRGKLDGL